ncbi:MAG: anaerobic glycerol-3-phosphate dehydrogenase subunit B [Caldilineaceae bacterium]|nr:anaerobic glycerol-3-phosphate dehydrogenase subunit B [Caldilineaceae bacterium]
MLDLLVIGAGLSGLTAAIYAAQAGLSVRVITKGLNALHWSAATIDLLGYLPDNSPIDAPFAALNHLPAPHPLRQVGDVTLRQALAELQGWLADEGLVYSGAADEANLWLPSAVGAKRPAYLAPTAQAAARLDDPSPLLIVGFDHFNDFYPALIAENLRRQGHAARAHILPLSLITDRTNPNNVHLAEGLDDLARLDALGEVLRHIVTPGERIAFPAILGLAQHPQVIAKLQSVTGAPVAEIPTLPPSVPGLRLHHALVRRLGQFGGRVESNMAAVEFGTEGDSIAWVATATSARPLRHRARTYLLATGGFLGGGFNSDHTGRSWETLFNLPLSMPASRGHWFRPEFLDPAGHPIFQGGVQVNPAWQPVDAQGSVLYSNLWAAGNLLAHADSIRTRSHEALALATGAAAAQAILAQRQMI